MKSKVHWKKLEASSLHIDFGLILTNLAFSVAEAQFNPRWLLYIDPACPWIQRSHVSLR